MFRTILGVAKWLGGTAALAAGAAATDDPLARTVLTIASGLSGTGAVATTVPNDLLRPLFIWIGKQLSKWGRKALGKNRWESAESYMQAGSFRAFLLMAVEAISEGMDADDRTR